MILTSFRSLLIDISSPCWLRLLELILFNTVLAFFRLLTSHFEHISKLGYVYIECDYNMIDILGRVTVRLSSELSGAAQSRHFIQTRIKNTVPQVGWAWRVAGVSGLVVISLMHIELNQPLNPRGRFFGPKKMYTIVIIVLRSLTWLKLHETSTEGPYFVNSSVEVWHISSHTQGCYFFTKWRSDLIFVLHCPSSTQVSLS